MNSFIRRTDAEIAQMTDADLIAAYLVDHPVPRPTRRFHPPQFQVAEGIVDPRSAGHHDGLEFSILQEFVATQRVPGCICKFCIIQVMRPTRLPRKYPPVNRTESILRFTYTFLLRNHHYQAGGQTTLISPAPVIRPLLDQVRDLLSHA